MDTSSVTDVSWMFRINKSAYPTSVTFGDRADFSKVTNSEGMFYNQSSLTSLTFPKGMTVIGDNAFGNCTKLTALTIPNTVTSIGYNAFGNVPHVYYNGSATGSPWGARAVN